MPHILATARFAALMLAPGILLSAQPANDRYLNILEPFLQSTMRETKMPGLAIGIVENGRLVYARGFGLMNIGEKGRPVTTKTLFHMASITKPFVATALMQLVERGKVDLNAPVIRYLPYFRLADPRYKEITVRQMVSHTSGMPDVKDYEWDKPQYDDGALERYVRSLTDKALRWDPGTKFAYSNMAFEVLGDLVAKVSGVSFDDYVHAHILKPLAMNSSTPLFKQVDRNLLADGYARGKDGSFAAVAHYPYNRAHTPSSNLHSNVEDMARWMIANLNRGELDGKRILKTSTYDLMWAPVSQTVPGQHVGISWFLGQLEGERTITHSGADDGFGTNLILVPEKKLGIVYMSNCDDLPRHRIAVAALRVAVGKALEPGNLP